MFSKNGFFISFIRAILLSIFIFHTCQVHSQDDTTGFTPEGVMITSFPGEISPDLNTPNGGTDATGALGEITVNPFVTDQTTNDPGGITIPFDQTTPESLTTTTPIVDSSTGPTVIPTTTIPPDVVTLCPPGQFPFSNGCIGASENGGVVITAFILSILSMIGALGILSYLLFCRKSISPKKSRMLTNQSAVEKPPGPRSTRPANKEHGASKQSEVISMEPMKPRTRPEATTTTTVVTETKTRRTEVRDKPSSTSTGKAKEDQRPLIRDGASHQPKPRSRRPPEPTDDSENRF